MGLSTFVSEFPATSSLLLTMIGMTLPGVFLAIYYYKIKNVEWIESNFLDGYIYVSTRFFFVVSIIVVWIVLAKVVQIFILQNN